MFLASLLTGPVVPYQTNLSSGSLEFSPQMTASTAQTVQYLNLAYFGRPADPASLTAFPASGMTDEQIVEQFVATSEYKTNTITPNSSTAPGGGVTYNTTNLINTFYQGLFGRLAVSSEINGWRLLSLRAQLITNIWVSPSCVQVLTCPLELRCARFCLPSSILLSSSPATWQPIRNASAYSTDFANKRHVLHLWHYHYNCRYLSCCRLSSVYNGCWPG